MFYHRTWLWVITMNFHLISYDEISNFFRLSQAYEQKTVLSNKSCKRFLGGSAISPNTLLENKSNSVPFLPQGKPYWGDFWGRAICFYSFHFSISKGDFLSLSPNAGVVLGWCMIKPAPPPGLEICKPVRWFCDETACWIDTTCDWA